jgi:hypothetical protein
MSKWQAKVLRGWTYLSMCIGWWCPWRTADAVEVVHSGCRRPDWKASGWMARRSAADQTISEVVRGRDPQATMQVVSFCVGPRGEGCQVDGGWTAWL